ncbi:MAG: SDR family NAD(P)-dependent oxidoreductase [Planctomycetes bacterium]|nr:SDR family NAD(P)-dependent oxidoreductase [Planctomycetota bacterium]
MTNRIIVLTGATRGLGRALIDPFIAEGHQVFGCGRSKERIASLKSAFPKGNFTSVDVTDTASVAAWAQQVFETAGPPDLLINNAAVMNEPGTLWTIPQADFDFIIDVNIKGVANVIRAFVPKMVEKKLGVIVNLSSGWGRSTSPEVAPYCATKYAIEGLSKALAQELPRGMASIPLNPGIIDTDMLRGAWGETAGSYPKAEKWAMKAAPFLLGLGASDNGKSLSVPG